MKTPLKYHGGKHYLADWILSYAPRHYLHYCEPFAGGLSVLFANTERVQRCCLSESVNDINGRLVNFWRVLRDNPKELAERLLFTPVSQGHWFEATKLTFADNVEDAAAYFVQLRQSQGGRGDCWHPLTRNRLRRGANEAVSSWLSSVDSLLTIAERLLPVVITCLDFAAAINANDSANTLFYCDPPYLQETRTAPEVYAHEMGELEHTILLNTLSGIKGKFILSGYQSKLYADYTNRFNWFTTKKNVYNNSSTATIKADRTEFLWMNYRPEFQWIDGKPYAIKE